MNIGGAPRLGDCDLTVLVIGNWALEQESLFRQGLEALHKWDLPSKTFGGERVALHFFQGLPHVVKLGELE